MINIKLSPYTYSFADEEHLSKALQDVLCEGRGPLTSMMQMSDTVFNLETDRFIKNRSIGKDYANEVLDYMKSIEHLRNSK